MRTSTEHILERAHGLRSSYWRGPIGPLPRAAHDCIHPRPIERRRLAHVWGEGNLAEQWAAQPIGIPIEARKDAEGKPELSGAVEHLVPAARAWWQLLGARAERPRHLIRIKRWRIEDIVLVDGCLHARGPGGVLHTHLNPQDRVAADEDAVVDWPWTVVVLHELLYEKGRAIVVHLHAALGRGRRRRVACLACLELSELGHDAPHDAREAECRLDAVAAADETFRVRGANWLEDPRRRQRQLQDLLGRLDCGE